MDPRTKSFECAWKAPEDGDGGRDLALINKYALSPLTADQVYTRTMALCNTRYDRSYERFPATYLKTFQSSILGKSLLQNHDKRGTLPLGRLYRAEMQTAGDGERELLVSFYMCATPGNEELRAQIDAGVVSHCSIGFRWGDLICDLCGVSYYGSTRNDATGERVWCPHVAGQTYDGKLCTLTYGGDLKQVEAVEASLVYLGCQYGSNITKSALWVPGDEEPVEEPAAAKERIRARYFARNGESATDPPRSRGAAASDRSDDGGRGREKLVTEEEKAARAAEEKAAADKVAAEKAVADKLAADKLAAEKMLADQALAKRNEELMAAIADVEPLVADGRLYREDLKAEVKRLAGLVAAEKEAELILKAAGQFDCTQLKALVAEYDARVEKLMPPSGVGVTAEQAAAAARNAGAGTGAQTPGASRSPRGGYSAL